jgi:hypothetical protein
MGNLLEWLLKQENKNTCRIIGIIMVLIPLAFQFGGGFAGEIEGHGIILSSGWFREIFMVMMTLMMMMGLVFIFAGFCRRKKEDNDD